MNNTQTEIVHIETEKKTLKAIEISFPFIETSIIGKRESFRKEIFRPIYHIHKWWANRLGSVFRAISLGVLLEKDKYDWEEFYEHHDFKNKVVLDPFMGSGTTLGEVAKLGAKPVGSDINPISTFAVKQALTRVDIPTLEAAFSKLEKEVSSKIADYYNTLDPDTGERIRVLYYYWVRVVTTPSGEEIPLFTSYVFSKNAYPERKPKAQILCPSCGEINEERYNAKHLICKNCGFEFNPQKGPATRQYVYDGKGERYKIKDLLPADGSSPKHRMYALMALKQNGDKIYIKPQDYDFALFKAAKERLSQEELPLPTLPVRPGHNTDQARGHNYTSWRDFFNARQLLCLGILLKGILDIEDVDVREQFLCLFSSTLEFNNLFCSFKGEGTGAVRHMFSHHILKPEKTPLENSVWGTEKSSGTFKTLFRSRLLKAKRYLDNPTDIFLNIDFFGDKKADKAVTVTVSSPLHLKVTDDWNDFATSPDRALVLNGDSATLPIPNKVIDAVVTDPPYFDFVHYSELSDFFYAWLHPVLKNKYSYFSSESSYRKGEVQNKDPFQFSQNLISVFRECHRVLKDDGLLAFSFHHSKPDGWAAIYKSIKESGFFTIATYPVHGEMTVASPKSSTKEPITLDMILVCKKQQSYNNAFLDKSVEEMVESYIQELEKADVDLSQTDKFNIYASLLLIHASRNALNVSDYTTQIKATEIG